MTTPPIPPGFNRGVPNPAREVSQTGNIGVPGTLTDAQGRPVRDPNPVANTVNDAGYLLSPNLAPRGQDVQGLTPQVGVQATGQALRQVLTEHTRALQAEMHSALNSHTQASAEAARIQREAAQELKDAARAVKDMASGGSTATPGGTPAPSGAPTGDQPPNSASQAPGAAPGAAPAAPAAPAAAGSPAQPGYRRISEMRRTVLQNNPPNSAAPDPDDPTDPLNIQRQQVSALEERFGGSLNRITSRAHDRAEDAEGQDQVLGPREGYESGFRSMHGMSARMLSPISRRLMQYQAPAPDLIQDENGNYRVRRTGRVSLERGVPNTPDRLATGSELEEFASGAARTGLVRGIGTRISTMGIAGVPGVGEAAVGLGMAHQALSTLANQREQNRQYQAIEGGTNMAGAAERGRAAMFGFSQMGVMSGGQAQQLFQGATEAGYRGSERTNALQVATDQFRRNGTDIAQTLQLMASAAETGGKQLTGVSSALDQITDVARKNGQNAAQLRQRFVEQYAQGAQTFGSAGGANATVATADVMATAGQGERFANVSNAGLNTEMSVRMQAQASGMQVGQYIQRASTDPNFRERGQSIETQRAAALASGGQTQMIQNRINELRQQHPDGHIPEEEIQRLATDLNNSGSFDPYNAARIESHFGITGITGQNASEMIVRQMSGAADPAAAGARLRAESAPQPLPPHLRGLIQGGDVQADEMNRRSGSTLSHIENLGASWLPHIRTRTEGNSPAANYARLENQTGQSHPVVQALLNQHLSGDTRFKVKSKGEDREVTLGDAIKYYSDQLETGNVQITSGNQKGQSVSAVTNGMGTGADPNQAGSANDVKHQHGKKYDPNSDKGGGGTVTISPTPELQQILRFSGQGNVAIQQAQATGTPPTSNVTPQQMPVGGN